MRQCLHINAIVPIFMGFQEQGAIRIFMFPFLLLLRKKDTHDTGNMARYLAKVHIVIYVILNIAQKSSNVSRTHCVGLPYRCKCLCIQFAWTVFVIYVYLAYKLRYEERYI